MLASRVPSAVLQRRCCAVQGRPLCGGLLSAFRSALLPDLQALAARATGGLYSSHALGEALVLLGSIPDAFEHKLAKLCMLSSQSSCWGTS